MINNKLKAIVFSLMLVVMLSIPFVAIAQNVGNRGMLGRGQEVAEEGNTRGMMNGSAGGYNLFNQQFGSDVEGGYELYNQTFGQQLPLGSGLLILTAAGVGYALKKRKSNMKQ